MEVTEKRERPDYAVEKMNPDTILVKGQRSCSVKVPSDHWRTHGERGIINGTPTPVQLEEEPGHISAQYGLV